MFFILSELGFSYAKKAKKKHLIKDNTLFNKKISASIDADIFSIFSFNYSARSVKRWKPVAVSSLSKPFKNSATEIFSFWQ